ncbi:MAG: bifunctional phosphoglucose/phosphomannose isomerase [Candidatus Gracilibacteria bacterium]|nr:bifunctional phosphoglucose/phosphomannose isomerase [Candidatus Gracilibacteria bacterium]
MDESLDQANLKQVLLDFPQQFMEGLKLTAGTLRLHSGQARPAAKVKHAVLLGMGGSSLPGDIVNLYLAPDFEIKINRDYDLHHKVDAETLVFACSYSGNTEEVTEALEKSLQAGGQVVIISAGGKLAEIATEKSLPFIKLPSGLQPRCATGYFFAAILQVLENAGLVKGKTAALNSLAQKLEAIDYQERAEELALQIKDKVPIVYTSDKYWPVARICKIKFNEHSKTQAFWNVFPELNHNEMVGFSTLVMKPFFLIYRDPADHERNKKRMQIFSNLLKDKGSSVVTIDMQGEDLLTKIFSTLLLGDWIAYYLALAYGIDPSPVEMVENFKELMKD